MEVQDITESAELKICEKHGEYHVRTLDVVGRVMRFENCQLCENEAKQAEEDADKERARQQDLENLKRKLKSVGITERHINSSFENYIADTEEKKKALGAAKNLSHIVGLGGQGNLLLIGNVGTGKTHLASAVARQVSELRTVKIVRCIDLMRELKATWRKGSEHSELDLINHYGNIDLLIIDEIGIQFDSQTEKMFIFDVINARYENKKPLMLMSNLNKQGVIECLGEQAVDRLKEDGCPIIAMDWESQRSKPNAKE